eukprot:11187755-Lingulodinium_polyedra.AAC.1
MALAATPAAFLCARDRAWAHQAAGKLPAGSLVEEAGLRTLPPNKGRLSASILETNQFSANLACNNS